MKRSTPMRRSPMKRGKGLAKQSKKVRAQGRRYLSFKKAVIDSRGPNCERCGSLVSRNVLELHHVLPRSRGGRDIAGNVRLLCRPCYAAVHDHTADDWSEWIVSSKPGRAS